jgi:ABC-type branched-subunit amino acid transport system substrate-binding protein
VKGFPVFICIILIVVLVAALWLVDVGATNPLNTTSTTTTPPYTPLLPTPTPTPTPTPGGGDGDGGSGPIKIGLLTSLSGFFSSYAPYQEQGARMVIDKINAAGGILGRPVELIIRDDQADPSLVSFYAAALQSAGVVGIIGSLMDANAAVLEQWAGANKMIVAATEDQNLSRRTIGFNK